MSASRLRTGSNVENDEHFPSKSNSIRFRYYPGVPIKTIGKCGQNSSQNDKSTANQNNQQVHGRIAFFFQRRNRQQCRYAT